MRQANIRKHKVGHPGPRLYQHFKLSIAKFKTGTAVNFYLSNGTMKDNN